MEEITPIIWIMAKPLLNQIRSLLIEKAKTVAVAESCTGGLLSKLLTDLPGSSRYFIFGAVTYSNQAKIKILRLQAGLIAKNGAVSAAVAGKMAQNARKLFKTDFGIAITGIAGPGGGSKDKPVGTVFIAVDSLRRRICKKFLFYGSRKNIRMQSALESLELLKKCLA